MIKRFTAFYDSPHDTGFECQRQCQQWLKDLYFLKLLYKRNHICIYFYPHVPFERNLGSFWSSRVPETVHALFPVSVSDPAHRSISASRRRHACHLINSLNEITPPLVNFKRGTQRGYSSKPLNKALLNVF